MKLSDICRVVSGEEDDSFVGLRLCGGSPSICFPVGYVLPPETELREAALHLLFVLTRAFEWAKQQGVLEDLGGEDNTALTPMWAYVVLLRDFAVTQRYYRETQEDYVVGGIGKIDWRRTIRSQTPHVGGAGCHYSRQVTRQTLSDSDSCLTRIHRHCVWQSYRLLGWLYGTTYLPPEETLPADAQSCAALVQQTLARAHKDGEKDVLRAMLEILEMPGAGFTAELETYGTRRFDIAWEMMVRFCFGNVDEKLYYPASFWHIEGEVALKKGESLRPDAIMSLSGAYFILDAKYYRIRRRRSSRIHLPGTADVNKQITYAEWVRSYYAETPIYNVFLLPGSSGGLEPELVGWNVPDWKESALREDSLAPQDCYTLVLAYRLDVRALMEFFARKPRGAKSLRKHLAQMVQADYVRARQEMTGNGRTRP